MTKFIVSVALGLLVVTGCAEDSEPVYTADCLGLEESVAYDCLEAKFWRTFQVDHGDRLTAYEFYQGVLDEHAEFEHPVDRAWAIMRRGQFGLAIALEDHPTNPAYYLSRISPDFDLAAEIDPDNELIVSWKASIEMAIAHVTGDNDLAVQIFNDAVERIEADPLGNVPSISGTSIGMPLSTGVPQRTIAMVDDWQCRDVAWCDVNTDHGPWVMPGMAYHWAEHYARMGNRDKTVAFLEESVAAPGYADWPYNYVVEDALADVDGLISKFTDLGEDGSAFQLMYANQDWGCKFCHAP